MEEQVFRIEIPVEAVDKTDSAALGRLEATLQKTVGVLQKSKQTTSELFEAVDSGASEARASIQQAEKATDKLSEGFEQVADSADEAAQAMELPDGWYYDLNGKLHDANGKFATLAKAATTAGQSAESSFRSAGAETDRFTQRIEKSEKTLRGMFKEKIQLTIAAIDRASPILKQISGTVKGLVGKAWRITVKIADFVTAPFRKLYNLINSPITMALSVAGIGFSVRDIVGTFNDFESGMSAVKALSGATNSEFLQLKETAKELGATTTFSASEASQGMQYLAMAGWETSEIIAAMPGLLDLAAAGATDLGTAADIVSDVMTAMGMEAAEASKAADIFAKAATSSNTTIEGLGNTMKYAAPIAASFGMNLEDVAAAAGLMANAGIKGEMAGTALRGSLLRMSSPTKEMAKTMKKLGISFADSSGKMKSMKEIIRALDTSFKGLSESQRLSYAQDLFGTEAASAWLGIISQGADEYDKMADSLYNSAGSAKEMAGTRLENLQGDITLLQSAVEGMKIDLVDKLNPYLRQGVQWLTGKIPDITDKISTFIDSAIKKGKRLKDFLGGVFSSSEFQNADGFAEKFFVAWDKIIAEPFARWWENGGSETILGMIARFGKTAGELLHGIVVGILAALKGEEIDFEGMNITGIAKAGAETAKSFVSSFAEGLNVVDMFGQMPGLMQTGLLGMGVFKVGQAGTGIYKTAAALKTAFKGVSAAASTAAPAVASVGAEAAASAVGVGKTVTVLGGLKTALAAVPVWGWVAAAAITALAVGIKLYKDEQARHEDELMHMGDRVEDSANGFYAAVKRVNEATSTIDQIHEVEINIKSSGLTATQIIDYQTELDQLKGRRIEIEAALASGTLTAEQAAAYETELEVIKSREESIRVQMKNFGVTEAQLLLAQNLISEINENTAEVKLIMANSSMSQREIDEYAKELSSIESRKVEVEAILTGAAMSQKEVAKYKQELEGIKDKTALIEARLTDDSLTENERKTLMQEYGSLKSREAFITLALSGQGLSQADLGKLVEEYLGLESKEAIITAQMAEGGMEQSDIEKVVATLKKIADQTAVLNVDFAVGSLDEQKLEDYNDQLAQLYGNLVQLSNGQITQADVDAGRVTDERMEQVEQTLATQANTKMLELETELTYARVLIPEQMERENQSQSEYEYLQGVQDNLATARINLFQLESDRASLVRQEGLNWASVETGSMSMDEYDEWYENTFKPGILGIGDRYNAEVAPYAVDEYGLPVTAIGEMTWDKLLGDNAFASNLRDITEAETRETGVTSDAQKSYDASSEQLQKVYNSEVSLLTMQAFEGTPYMEMPLADIAQNYEQLDEAGRQMFNDAMAALATLNAQTDYISEDQKTQAIDIADLTAKTEVMQTVQTQAQTIADNYDQMTASQQDAFSSLTEVASDCKTSVDNLKAALDALDGTTATVDIVRREVGVAGGPVAKMAMNASGGIYDGAFLSWVAEDGPEAIIPLGEKRRGRGLDLWMQAGEMLGVAEFANGGILAPYSAPLSNLPDNVWEGDNSATSPQTHTGGGTGGRTITVDVSTNPVFNIEGASNPDSILEILKSKQRELAELVGDAIADELEDIVSNMA